MSSKYMTNTAVEILLTQPKSVPTGVYPSTKFTDLLDELDIYLEHAEVNLPGDHWSPDRLTIRRAGLTLDAYCDELDAADPEREILTDDDLIHTAFSSILSLFDEQLPELDDIDNQHYRNQITVCRLMFTPDEISKIQNFLS